MKLPPVSSPSVNEPLAFFYVRRYPSFVADVLNAALEHQDLPVRFVSGNQPHSSYHHVCTVETPPESGTRCYDAERIGRCCWCGPILVHGAGGDHLKFWKAPHKGAVRHYFWAFEHDYVTILEKRRGHFGFVTAFCVSESKASTLERDYLEYLDDPW